MAVSTAAGVALCRAALLRAAPTAVRVALVPCCWLCGRSAIAPEWGGLAQPLGWKVRCSVMQVGHPQCCHCWMQCSLLEFGSCGFVGERFVLKGCLGTEVGMSWEWGAHGLDFSCTSTHHSCTGAGASMGWAGCMARGRGRAERAVLSSNQCRLHSVLVAALNSV